MPDTLIEKLKFEVWHAAQDTEFDDGFSIAKEMAIKVIENYRPSEISAKEYQETIDRLYAEIDKLQKRESGEDMLPKDVHIGTVVFKKGVKLDILINAARRWYGAVKGDDGFNKERLNSINSIEGGS